MKEKHRTKAWGGANFLEESFDRGLHSVWKFTKVTVWEWGSFRDDRVVVLWRYPHRERCRLGTGAAGPCDKMPVCSAIKGKQERDRCPSTTRRKSLRLEGRLRITLEEPTHKRVKGKEGKMTWDESLAKEASGGQGGWAFWNDVAAVAEYCREPQERGESGPLDSRSERLLGAGETCSSAETHRIYQRYRQGGDTILLNSLKMNMEMLGLKRCKEEGRLGASQLLLFRYSLHGLEALGGVPDLLTLSFLCPFSYLFHAG